MPLREKPKESELLASLLSSHCKIRGNEEEKLPVRLEEKKRKESIKETLTKAEENRSFLLG